MAKEFVNLNEAIKYAVEHYGSFIDEIEEDEKNKISVIQSRGLFQGLEFDDECIAAIRRCLINCPELPEDVIVYRGGKMKYKNRPYLSASFLKSVAKEFAHGCEFKTHKIILRKGSKIFPLCVFNFGFSDPEAELIFDVSCLKWHFGYYEYSERTKRCL